MSDEKAPPTCPECGATENAAGAAFTPFTLGAHRAAAHGYVSPKRAARRAGRHSRDEARPIVSAIREVRDEIPKGTKPPSADELGSALGRGLSIVSIAVASYAAETDPRELDDAQTDELVDYLSLPKNDARYVMDPIARTFAKTGLNRRYGRAVVDNVEVVAAFAELAKLGLHWRSYFRTRARITAGGAPAPRHLAPVRAPVVQTTGSEGPPSAVAPVVDAASAGVVPVASGNGSEPEGVVWTAEMVAAARAARGGQ